MKLKGAQTDTKARPERELLIDLPAAAEFQKIIHYRGLLRHELIWPLAHLQLGRAYALTGDTTKAKMAYQDFLTLWKDADPDIPLLKQSKAEYEKLK